MSEPIHIISLGAGVQSSTMALMAAHGEITPLPKCSIFADTQDEPRGVYEHLKILIPALPFPVIQVSAGKLSDVLLRRKFLGKNGKRSISIPSYGDRGGISLRQCTREFKVDCINRKIRELRNGAKKVVLWIGISLDEVHRMKPNQRKSIENRWPLIEKRMTRHDCLRWLASHGYPQPPKSACIYCPYHSDPVWREIKHGNQWDEVVAIDHELNKRGQFLHKSRLPIDQVDFSTDEDHGQQVMFGNECEGMCGV